MGSGTFTAPFDGLYYFAWTGISGTETKVHIDSTVSNDHLCSSYTSAAYQPLNCHAIVNLKKGDQVWTSLANYRSGFIIEDDDSRFTNFIGKLMS